MGRDRRFRTSFRAGLGQRPPRWATLDATLLTCLTPTLAEFGVCGVVSQRDGRQE